MNDNYVKQIDDAPTNFVLSRKIYKNNPLVLSLVSNSSKDEIIGFPDDRPNEYTIFDENDDLVTKKVPDDFIYSREISYDYKIIATLEI